MAFYLITFSPTGGTRRAAGLFAQSFSKESCFVDLTDRSLAFSGIAFSAQDICLAAVPAYGGRVPHPAAARLAQMHGGGARAILMAVYGSRAYEDTLAELYDLLIAAGFRCTAGVSAVAQHSIFPQFAAGRPDAADAAQLAAFARQVRAVLDGGHGTPACSAGQQALPASEGNGPEAARGHRLHLLRPVRPAVSGGGYPPARARADGHSPLHRLHAVCRRLPRPCAPCGRGQPWQRHAKGCKRPAKPTNTTNCSCKTERGLHNLVKNGKPPAVRTVSAWPQGAFRF